ncbi:MAG: hypothetical protein LC790_08915 [Actinobacteria bacterium]|nr:hypothetical protein [Actinomycetota bacterium]
MKSPQELAELLGDLLGPEHATERRLVDAAEGLLEAAELVIIQAAVA